MWVRSLNRGIIEEIAVDLSKVFKTVMTLWALVLNIKNWISSVSTCMRTIMDTAGLLSVMLILLALSLIYLSARENLKVKTLKQTS